MRRMKAVERGGGEVEVDGPPPSAAALGPVVWMERVVLAVAAHARRKAEMAGDLVVGLAGLWAARAGPATDVNAPIEPTAGGGERVLIDAAPAAQPPRPLVEVVGVSTSRLAARRASQAEAERIL